MYESILNSMIQAARAGGALILAAHDHSAHWKEGHFNFATDTDLKVQQNIQEMLGSDFPNVQFFAEEQENRPLSDVAAFVVDPIDGTINFARGRRASVVSIAYLEKQQPVCAVVYQPYSDECFTAIAGRGAFLNGSPIHTADTPLSRAVVAFGTSPYDPELCRDSMQIAADFMKECGDLRRVGAAALDLCDVACGRSDVFFELRLRPWDVAAGALIVKEAGGIYASIGLDAPVFSRSAGAFACCPSCSGAMAVIQKTLKR